MSTKKSRRKFSDEFKAKVCLEAIKERKTLSELAVQFEVHPGLISNWKNEFVSKSKFAFSQDAPEQVADTKTSELYQRIGELEMENQFLKKSLKKLGL